MPKDHVDYGSDLDLIVDPRGRISVLDTEFGTLVGAGIPFFSVGGGVTRTVLHRILTDFHVQRGYRVAMTPAIASSRLFAVSGHLDFYRENMYIFNIDEHEFAIKPMNCPFHVLILMNALQRYRNRVSLPFRIFELGHVHRYELSGALYGLLRVRGFTQDDAHVFSPSSSMEAEILKVYREMVEIYEHLFHLPVEEISLRLSLSDPSEIGKEYIGSREEWEEAEEFLRRVADRIGVEYTEEKGEAAFYGPKLDVVVGEWQLGTVQFDFNLPRRFHLLGLLERVGLEPDLYMIHRAYLGSIERFLGAYLEKFQGRLPFVLNPVQILVISVLSGGNDGEILKLAEGVTRELKSREFRAFHVSVDRVGLASYIRKVESGVKPSVLVFIGEKEIESHEVPVKYYDPVERKRKDRKVVYESVEDIVNGVHEVTEYLETPVDRLTGRKYRLPVDLSHLL